MCMLGCESSMYADKKSIDISGYKIILAGLSEKGIEKKINQDAVRIGADAEKGIAYIVIADGLGSCKYSDKGAEKIVSIVEDWILEKLPAYSYLSDNVANILAKRMIESWNESYSIEEIYDYDTTLHMAVFYKGSVLIGGIGDGMSLVSYDDLICKDLIDAKNLFSNVTNSMCSINAGELVVFDVITAEEYAKKLITILSTDGISDDLIPEKKLTLPAYFQEIISTKGENVLQDELIEWIEDWETEGHSDDKTLCYLSVEKEDVWGTKQI